MTPTLLAPLSLPLPSRRCILFPDKPRPCRAVPCRAVPCRAVPCRAVPCRAVPCRAVPCRAVPCRAVPCRAVPCRAVPCRAVPCRAVPCPALPCSARQLRTGQCIVNSPIQQYMPYGIYKLCNTAACSSQCDASCRALECAIVLAEAAFGALLQAQS